MAQQLVDKAAWYLWSAETLLDQAREELRRGNHCQAAEKLWCAAASAVRGYGAAVGSDPGRPTRSTLDRYRETARRLGPEALRALEEAYRLHNCFCNSDCSPEEVEKTLPLVERLVHEAEKAARKVSNRNIAAKGN